MRPGLRILPPETSATPTAQASSQPSSQPASQPARPLKSNSLSLFYKKRKPPTASGALSSALYANTWKQKRRSSGLCSVPAGLHQAEDALLLPAVLSPWTGANHLDPVPAHSAAWTRADEGSSPRPGDLPYPSGSALLNRPFLIVVCLRSHSWWCAPCTPSVKWRPLICASRRSSQHTRTCPTPART